MALSTQIKPDSISIIGLTPNQYNLLLEALQNFVVGFQMVENVDFDDETLIEVIKNCNEMSGVSNDGVTIESLPTILEDFRAKKLETSFIINVLTTPNVNLN
jgi:hypothetical protein